jgi:hypothetical protein
MAQTPISTTSSRNLVFMPALHESRTTGTFFFAGPNLEADPTVWHGDRASTVFPERISQADEDHFLASSGLRFSEKALSCSHAATRLLVASNRRELSWNPFPLSAYPGLSISAVLKNWNHGRGFTNNEF